MAKAKAKQIGKWPKPPTDKPHQCPFCGKCYSSEKSLINHTCKYRLRWNWRDNRDYSMAFMIYCHYYTTQFRGNKPSYEDFMYGRYFDAFVKFAVYMLNNDITEPQKFIDFVMKHGIRLDDWCKDGTYELYIRHHVENEPALRAAERNVLLMQQYGDRDNYHWTEFFDRVAPAEAVRLVKMGRLSPWIIYGLASAQMKLLARFSPEQLELIEQYAPVATWKKKFFAKRDDLNDIRQIFESVGL